VTAVILDGKAIASHIVNSVAERAAQLAKRGATPHLAFVSIGESEPAEMYAARLRRLAGRAGMLFSRTEVRAEASPRDLESAVAALNVDPTVDGILVQMPLPDGLISADLSTVLDVRKDVDGITIANAGRLYLGLPGHVPSTALAMMEVLKAADVDPRGKNAVVVGRSTVVGHPVAELLLRLHATVTITHSRTADLASHVSAADIVMAAVGRPGLITGDIVKQGATIIDAGINVTEGGLVGDVEFASCVDKAAAITPVPGGVGPVTNAVLLRAVIESGERRPS
jgi:methylenetetrahydrofolate dehydrogenase (NADP+)/methenyltetrahydrofolate cyclohydrolase